MKSGWRSLFHPSSNENSYGARRKLIAGVSLLLAGIFLYFVLRDLNWDTFFSTIRKAQLAYLPLFAIWGSLVYGIRAYRWKTLLDTNGFPAFAPVFMANMAGYLGNMILPARAGELIRATYIARQANMQASFTLATGLTERLIDGITLVALGFISLLSTGLLSSTMEASFRVMGLIALTGLLALLLLPRLADRICELLQNFPLLPRKYREQVNRIAWSFLTGLTSISREKRAGVFILLTLLIWFADATGMVLLARILWLPLTLVQALVLLAALGLSSALPSTPGYVGVYQFAAVLALRPFGFSSADAVALVVAAQLMNLMIIGLWGLLAATQFSEVKRQMNEAARDFDVITEQLQQGEPK